MRRHVLLAASAFLGCLLISSGGARADSKAEFLEALSSAPPEVDAPLSAPAPLELGDKATCTANCQGAGSASCTASGSCTAVDRNCTAGQRGYAQCGSTTVYCNPCGSPTCNAVVNCGSTSISCSGYSSCTPFPRSCPSQRGSVNCDGVVKFCPFCSTPDPCGPQNCIDGATCNTDNDCGCTQYGSCSASKRCVCR
jgi:hypothetical protein